MSNERMNQRTETFIVPAGPFAAVQAVNFSERRIQSPRGPLSLHVQNNGAGAILLELRQGSKSLSGSVAAEELDAHGTPGDLNLSDTLTEGQCVPGTLVVRATGGSEQWTDDGNGLLVPDEDNTSTFVSGTINYLTGEYTLVTTGTDVAAGAIEADYDIGFRYAGNVETTQIVSGVAPRVDVNIFGYSNAQDATYLSVAVTGDIGATIR